MQDSMIKVMENVNPNLELNPIDEHWVPLQAKVFTRWFQLQLNGKSNTKIEDITKDLTNGVALCELATILTKKQPNRNWVHEPTRKVDMVQNCELAIKMFENDGVHFVGISGKDINDNNEKLILGLVWSLIVHYSIVRSVENERENGLVNNAQTEKNPIKEEKKDTQTLLNWAQDRTANYPGADDFKRYDLGMLALLDTYVPDKVNYDKIDQKDTENTTKLATDVMKDLGIPVLVYPEEVKDNNNQVDRKSLLTQLSSAKFVLDQSFHDSGIIRRSGMQSEASQMSSEANQSEEGERIALDSMRTNVENGHQHVVKTRDANGKQYSTGSNLIDLNSIPMNLNNQNKQLDNSNLIDLNSIPVITEVQPAGQSKRRQDSILVFGQNESGEAAGTGNTQNTADAVVESSSEVDSTSSEVDGYDESDEGENKRSSKVNAKINEGKFTVNGVNNGVSGIAGANGHSVPTDSNGHPIPTGENGSSSVNGNGVGANGVNGSSVSGVNGVNGSAANGKGFGVDANGVNGSTVNGNGTGANGANGVNGNGFGVGAHGAIGAAGSGVNGFDANGHPISSGANGVNGSSVNGNGFGANGINGHHDGVAGAAGVAGGLFGVAGTNGKYSTGFNGTNIDGHSTSFGTNGINNGIHGVTGSDGKVGSGVNGFDANGHPISGVNGVNGSSVNGNGVNGSVNGKGYGVNGVNGANGANRSSVNGNGVGVNGTKGVVGGLNGTSLASGVAGHDGKVGTVANGFDVNGHPISGVNGVNRSSVNGNGVNGSVNGKGFDVNGVNGTNGTSVNGTNGVNGVNGNGVGVNGVNGTTVDGIGFRANGINGTNGVNGSSVNGKGFGVNGVNGTNGVNGSSVNGVNGIHGVNGASSGVAVGVAGVDGKHGSGVNGFDAEGHPIPSGANGVNGLGVHGVNGASVNGTHGVNDGVDGVHGGAVSQRDAALGSNGKSENAVDGTTENGVDGEGHPDNFKVLSLEDKYLTRKMSIRHVKLCKPGEKNAYNAALPWYISISGKRRHDEILRSQEFNNEDTCLTRRMSLPHFRFVTEEPPQPAPQAKDDQQVSELAKEKAIESIEENSDDELLDEQAKNAIKQTPEDKVLTRKLSIRHIKLLKEGEKNYFEKNLKWYVSVSGKNRGSHEENKNVTRDFKISPEDAVLTRHMSVPHFKTEHPVPKPKPVEEAPKVDPEVEARNKANAEYDAQQAKNAIKQSPEEMVLTRNMSIRHVKLCKDGERNYFDNNLPWYVSVSGKARGSPEETKNVTRDFKLNPEDVVLTRKMDIPRYNDPKCTEEYKQQQKKLRDEANTKKREAKLAQDEEDRKYEEEHAHSGIELTPEDKVLTRKMSIRHIKLCKDGEKNYHDAKLPWYVSISGKRRGSADDCKLEKRNFKFGPEDIVLTRHMSLPQFVSDDEHIVEVDEDEIEAPEINGTKTRDVNLEEETIEETPEQKAKELNLEDKVLTRKLSIRHIRNLKQGEKNYKRPNLPWYVSCSGKWRGSHNEQKAVTRDIEFDQEDKLLTRKLNLPHYVRPKCDEKGANNNYTTQHMFDVKKKWW